MMCVVVGLRPNFVVARNFIVALSAGLMVEWARAPPAFRLHHIRNMVEVSTSLMRRY
jgi:hypothetical protein